MTRNTAGQHAFAQIPSIEIPRSSFNRSCGYKSTFSSGWLVPIFLDEALPGDTFAMRAQIFARLATPLHALMDNIVLDVFWFAVPHRILWSNWNRFMGEQLDPADSTDYEIPQNIIPTLPYLPQSLADYFGIPVGVPDLKHSVLPFRAYNLIHQEWFRDENLVPQTPVPLDNGPDDMEINYTLLKRGKRHDYFTSCLPFAQKGDPVPLALGGTAPVTFGSNAAILGLGSGPLFEDSLGVSLGGLQYDGTAGDKHVDFEFNVGGANPAVNADWKTTNLYGSLTNMSDAYADLGAATAATINQLRFSFQLQKLLEKHARGGSRLTELIRSEFGVTSPDARLQRPEYLGSGSVHISINTVAQNSASSFTGTDDAGPTSQVADTPQGNLAAFGVGSGGGIGFTKSFTEHSYVMGLICARADLSYQQGLERHWSRKTRFEFYTPSFAHLGEQAVLNKEIYAQGFSVLDSGDIVDDKTFGFQERWAEYRYKPSLITGKFKSGIVGTLDAWHLAQEFLTLPVLGQTFIEEDPPIDRVIAVQNEPEFLLDCFFSYRCIRPMPTYSVPGLIDHF